VLRSIGGLLFASGALVLFIRKTSHWGDFALLLVLAIPAVLLYALGSRGPDSGADEDGEDIASPWQSVLLVYAIFLTPLALFQFLQWIGGTTGDSLNQAWIFALTGGLAVLVSRRVGVWYGGFLAALSFLIAWLSLWDKILDHPSATTTRWLLIIFALLALAGAAYIGRTNVRRASEVVTIAGLAAVVAGIFGLAGTLATVAATRLSFGGAPQISLSARQHTEWDIYLLVVSLLLIWYASRRGVRGPAYVGGLGLIAFIFSAGAQIVRLLDGESVGSVWAWPIILLVLGAVLLAAGFLRSSGPSSTVAQPPPAEPPPAAAPPPPAAGS
jgi:hypothetical protein